jgi:hypothetical protein
MVSVVFCRATEIADTLSGLPAADRRAILRIVTDISTMARERAALRKKAVRLKREVLEKALPEREQLRARHKVPP